MEQRTQSVRSFYVNCLPAKGDLRKLEHRNQYFGSRPDAISAEMDLPGISSS